MYVDCMSICVGACQYVCGLHVDVCVLHAHTHAYRHARTHTCLHTRKYTLMHAHTICTAHSQSSAQSCTHICGLHVNMHWMHVDVCGLRGNECGLHVINVGCMLNVRAACHVCGLHVDVRGLHVMCVGCMSCMWAACRRVWAAY